MRCTACRRLVEFHTDGLFSSAEIVFRVIAMPASVGPHSASRHTKNGNFLLCCKFLKRCYSVAAVVQLVAVKKRLLLQLRQKRLPAARTILGLALGKAAKPKLFKYYIDLETQLAQVRSQLPVQFLYSLKFGQMFHECRV